MKNNDKIPEGNPFKVPDNYFEDVKKRIISSTVESYEEIKKPGIYLKLRPYFAAAASIAVLTLLTYTGVLLFSHGNKVLSLSGISVEEYSETILNDIDLLTLEQNAAFLDLQAEKQYLEEKDIIDYLILENIDINEIQEQL